MRAKETHRNLIKTRKETFMKRLQSSKLITSLFVFALLLVAPTVFSGDDIQRFPSCPLCGMNRGEYAFSRMLIEYDDGTATGTCSIHCTAAEMSLRREKTISRILVADYNGKHLIPSESALFVIGGDKTGVMTKQAKWAFAEKGDAEKFIMEHGGRLSSFDEAMKSTFEDMYSDIKMLYEKRKKRQMDLSDTRAHPDCIYCGMDRVKYAHSRMLTIYDDGTSVGTCSIHCTAIDLALHTDKTARSVFVGDYRTKNLIDAERAFWVIGGNNPGVMTIRPKWAFAEKRDAEEFMKEHGGKPASYEEAMKASFEDMYEILR
jgi:copper chaperone NosL